MIAPLQLAINHISTEIPQPILHLAFPRSSQMDMTTLEDRIINNAIRLRVIPDCNIVSGKLKTLELQQSWVETTVAQADDWAAGVDSYSIYRIPPESRDYVPITEVCNIEPPRLNVTNQLPTSAYGTSNILSAAHEMLDSYTHNSHISRPTAERVGIDLIRLSPAQAVATAWLITLRLEYDGNLQGLNSSAMLAFAQLCVVGCKMIIYNNLAVQFSQGYIQGGQEIGAVMEIVNGYSDASADYFEKLRVFTGGASFDINNFRMIARATL